MTDQDLRVRQLAYRIWESEGRPTGQEQRHWDMALKIVNAERTSGEAASGDIPPTGAPGDEALSESLGEEDASMDDRGASDYAQPEPPTAPAQAPVSPGSEESGVIAKAEKKARAAVGKATGSKTAKPKAKDTKDKSATGGTATTRAKKTPKASTRKPKGDVE